MADIARLTSTRKILAALLACAWIVGLQCWIYFRTRAPEPTVAFPKELKDSAP